MKSFKYVIIGNSVAGINAAEAIRSIDKKGSLCIISDEKYHIYSRPLISYYLAGKINKERMYYRDMDFYKENNIDLMLSKKTTSIDASKKKNIGLADGEKIVFEKLLVATGGKPIIPEGFKTGNGVFTFIKWDDADGIKEYIKKKNVKNVVVVGAGLIGLKATEGLMGLGVGITIVELADTILSATFDKEASLIIEKALSKSGCKIKTGTTVKEIVYKKSVSKNEKTIEKVILKNKEKIPCQLVILAIGVTPNTELAKNTQIKVNRGIVVDDKMQTTVKDIFAAGDVVEGYDFLLGVSRPIAIWPNASKQGKVAGYNMAGSKKTYEGSFAMNSVELGGIPTISMGITAPVGPDFEVLSELNKKEATYKKIIIKDSKIVGAIFVNKIDRAGIFTGLIKNKVDTKSFKEKLLNDDFGLISLPKEYRKHIISGPGIEI